MDGPHAVKKEESVIGVGDIVFCEVQRSKPYYAHIVLAIEHDYFADELKYWIGNIEGHYNGYCFREHIFGILVQVQVEWEGKYYARPFPKSVFEEVSRLVKDSRWSSRAKAICKPSEEQVGVAFPEAAGQEDKF